MISVLLIRQRPELFWLKPDNDCSLPSRSHYRNIPVSPSEKLGVEVSFGQPVTECSAEGVVYGGQPLPAKTIIWAAGVTASPAARWLKTEADRAGRVIVGADLTLPLHPEIFVIGDTAAVTGEDGRMIPGHCSGRKTGRTVCG